MGEIRIDRDRLWQRHMQMAEIGATPEGGSNRPALSADDVAGRVALLRWCEGLNLAVARDAIGNLFLRRAGTQPNARAVAFGSHLDTVPTGGRFDGVFGVLAGLEVLTSIHEAGLTTRAPLELAVWTNEEGSRFPPAMMGSRFHTGDLPLAAALSVRDDSGISVAQALAQSDQAGELPPGPRDWACWIEPHVEQGPVLEAHQQDIGIVTGTVQARYFHMTITGEPSHVGPTTMDLRRDSLAAAADVVLAVEKIGQMGEPRGRSSCTWIENVPNVRGTVAGLTRLHCDIRHEDLARLDEMERTLRDLLHDIVARRLIRIDIDPYAVFGPVRFDAALCDLLRRKAREQRLATRNMVSAAGHDSALLAGLYPSAMLFVPSIAGITHNPNESSSPEHLANGAQVLLDAVLELAR